MKTSNGRCPKGNKLWVALNVEQGNIKRAGSFYVTRPSEKNKQALEKAKADAAYTRSRLIEHDNNCQKCDEGAK